MNTYQIIITTIVEDVTFIQADTPSQAKQRFTDLLGIYDSESAKMYLDYPTNNEPKIKVIKEPLTKAQLNDRDYRGDPKAIAECNTEEYIRCASND